MVNNASLLKTGAGSLREARREFSGISIDTAASALARHRLASCGGDTIPRSFPR